ncbi:MAG TPA: universal stress protein [Saprospiraceae bacterium]|nr:universal stress protein [Saprospiraceae bacterium]
MEIELFSVKGFKGNLLKNRLETALAKQHLPYHVKENHSVDDFIKAGLISVPALKIGNKVIECPEEMPFDETVQKALALIQAGMDQFILVPVDFTPESLHALRYARMMASHLHMAITVAFIHEPLIDPVTNSACDIEMMNFNRKRLDELLVDAGWDHARDTNHVHLNTYFATGDITTHLLKLAEDDKFEFIIMGTKAEDTFMKRMFGSVSTHLSRKISKPVIVVPPDASLKFSWKIIVGLTDELMEKETLDFILDYASTHRVFVDFVYATNDQDKFKKLNNSLYEKLVLHKTELCGFNIRSLPFSEDHVHEALSDYAILSQARLLVLVTKHRNFIESLGHRSVSKKALLQPLLPVMILHSGIHKNENGKAAHL